jgi:uncharacterized protein YceH (UPF0502 family)
MSDSTELPILSPAEARVLGCLIEKRELTPDVYPLTVNALVAAANQKTAREPVMALEIADVNRALGTLQHKGLVRQQFASRVERYEHLMAQKFSLTQAQIALLGLLMLRGPQTAYELLARAERMGKFSTVEDVKGNLDMLIGRKPALAAEIGRGPGQREDRFAHLLSGEVQIASPSAAQVQYAASSGTGLVDRVIALEEDVAELRRQVVALMEGRT